MELAFAGSLDSAFNGAMALGCFIGNLPPLGFDLFAYAESGMKLFANCLDTPLHAQRCVLASGRVGLCIIPISAGHGLATCESSR